MGSSDHKQLTTVFVVVGHDCVFCCRRLAEFGYNRSAKKCKEKFENIHKYYKKTKSGQAGRRQDGKNYRFFSELDALYGGDHHQHRNKAVDRHHHHHHHHHAGAAAAILQSTQSAGGGSGLQQAAGIADHAVGLFRAAVENHATSTAAAAADSDSSEDNYDHGPQLGRESDLLDDDDDDDDGGGGGGGDAQRSKKRKLVIRQQQQSAGGVGRPHRSNNSTSRKVLFFESLMKKLMDKQDAMQRKFLESIERREQERLVREEAWKRQEMAHLARDHELRIQHFAASTVASSSTSSSCSSSFFSCSSPSSSSFSIPSYTQHPCAPTKSGSSNPTSETATTAAPPRG
jgi:hypothetical protein